MSKSWLQGAPQLSQYLDGRSGLVDRYPWAINKEAAEVRRVGSEHHRLMGISGMGGDDGVDTRPSGPPRRCSRPERRTAVRPDRAMTAPRRADDEIVKVAAHLESTRLVDPTDAHRLEAGRSDQPLDFLAGTVVIGRVEEHRRLR